MKKLLIILTIVLFSAVPVSATQIEPIQPSGSAEALLPQSSGDFAKDLWYVVKTAIAQLRPDIADGINICMSLFAAGLLISLLRSFDGMSKSAVDLTGIIIISALLLESANSMVHLGVATVQELSDYGKLMLPVLTTALAAQGGISASAALYAGTAIFDAVLTTAISALLVPLVYVFIVFSILHAATDEDIIKRLKDFVKWLMTWCLKTVMYVFIGYISITGVVSGATDQMKLKATKLTISSAVPVIGNILSDASEAVLVSMGVMKSAAGVYGILALIAILIGPFLKIGLQYILLKLTAGICTVVSSKKNGDLIEAFSAALGFLLAMTGAICLMQLISFVCFMKGVQ